MSEPQFEIETYHKVYENAHGEYVRVGPDADGLGLVEIDGKDHFGGRIVVKPRMAMYIARAILNTVKALEAAQTKNDAEKPAPFR